jgi:electron-transferring-flavoprotein dehydrogenase
MSTETPAQARGPREVMQTDVLIVGAGPAGLAAAIRIRQKAALTGQEVGVIVLEKGSAPGAHTLSGAVMDPKALQELFPDWKNLGAPLRQEVTGDDVLFLTPQKAWRTPDWLVPRNFHNHGNYVVSLGEVVQWMASQAEALGVEIYPGFAASEVLYGSQGEVQGVATGDLGVGKDGKRTAHYQPGMELRAKYTLFAEGARGHLGRQLLEHYKLDANRDPATYALGIKEVWEIPADLARPGLVVHTAGWPLAGESFGGGFLYHMDQRRVSLGLVVGLDYRNPFLSPFDEMQRWKTHPALCKHLEGGKRLGYGARAINNGGLQALPKTVFPGGALIGCEAGYMNAARIKGSHAAIFSGMLCADSVVEALLEKRQGDELATYPQAFEKSWLHQELHQSRNFKPWFKKGFWTGTLMTGIEHWLMPHLGLQTPPWTLHHQQADHTRLLPATACEPKLYPKPDGTLVFDRLSSVFLSNTNHEENQPAHLTLRNPDIPVQLNLNTYAGPETRYCPAGVYEYLRNEKGQDHLQINAQNCVHCKTCDIKDPSQNIVWITPEGGGGPNYAGM